MLPARALAGDEYARARESYGGVEVYLRSAEAAGMSHSELERELEQRMRELARQLLQAHLDARGDGEASAPVTGADGVTRPGQRLQERELETVFGAVTVRRVGYGAPGVESLHPKDAALNLPEERYSLEVRRRAALEAAKVSFDEVVATLERSTGAHVPKRQAEELVVRAARDFDAFYEQCRASPREGAAGAAIVVLSFDGKGVVMRRQDLREPTRKAAARRTRKLATRLSRGEKRNAKRMATVSAVYTIAPYPRTAEQVVRSLARTEEAPSRPRPEHKRVSASLEKTSQEVIAEGFAEAVHRDPERERTWVVVVDGSKPQLRLIEQEAARLRVRPVIVLDIIHVIEYLWKAGMVFHTEGSGELEAWVRARLLAILEGSSSQVAAGMRRSATRRGVPVAARKAVDTCANYLLAYRRYLRYDDYLARGLPIATGVIEGACRHLVKDRMDLTGARWSLAGAEAVLRLRALRASGDFDEYWRFHEAREYKRNHEARYASGSVPSVKPPQPAAQRRLKLVT